MDKKIVNFQINDVYYQYNYNDGSIGISTNTNEGYTIIGSMIINTKQEDILQMLVTAYVSGFSDGLLRSIGE